MKWIQQYIDYKGITVYNFEKKLGTRSTIHKAIKSNSKLRSDILSKIIETFSDIRAEWLLTGEGEMIKETPQKQPIMSKNSLIKQNILQYIDYKRITKYKFYKLTGITRGFLDSSSGSSEETIAKFIAYFKDVNISWLLTGEGEMLKETPQNQPIKLPKTPQKKISTDPRIYEIQELTAQLHLTAFGIGKDLGIATETIKNIIINGPRATRSKTLAIVLKYLHQKAGHTGTAELAEEFILKEPTTNYLKINEFNKLSIEEKLTHLHKQLITHDKKTAIGLKSVELILKTVTNRQKL